ncbi:MAG: recombinase family protein [Nanoarchaeota archaeon]|nr:recombinase family protein [Nanoarchaeota archaeon]
MDNSNAIDTVIYLRTSTNEQNPELQREQCLKFCKNNNLNVVKIFVEQKSAYKDVDRIEWNKCLNLIQNKKYNLVVFRYDRAFRKREEFVEFMSEMHQIYKLKVYSVSENWLNSLWEGLDKIPELPAPFNKIIQMFMQLIWNILIELIGEQAEEESRKKGASIKNAVVKRKGKKTRSKYGNKWGKKGLSKQTKNKIIELNQNGFSTREISKQVQYTDKNKNMVFVSKSAVHKTLHEFSMEKSSNLASP